MEGEMKNLVEVCSSAIASLCYCYFVSSRIRKGKYRLISLLPVLSLFTLLPLHLTFTLPTIAAGFLLVWVSNFRLLLFAFDMGPLSQNPDSKSLSRFILLACFPVKIGHNRNSKKHSKLILNLPTETLLLSLGHSFVYRYMEILNENPIMKMGLYLCINYLMLEVIVDFGNAAVSTVGLVFGPSSDEPFFSTSIQDFWGKRWNLVITNHLRVTEFEPVRAAFGPVMGREWANTVGVFATFLVSGLMHELIYYYPTRVKPTWAITGFFVLHGLCDILEFRVKRALEGRLRLHCAVCVLLTSGFLVVTSFWLYITSLIRVGLDQRIISEPFIFLNYLKSALYK